MARRGEPKRGEPVPDLPERPSLASIRQTAAGCKACELYKRGTQTVFGEGPRRADIMLVGEQPGEAEMRRLVAPQESGRSPSMTEMFRPTLLLSMPQLQDPNFSRTVVLLCDFLPEGAFGIVLNRPTDMPATAMVRLEPAIVHGNGLPLCVGGPVEPDRGWILTADRPVEPEYRTILEGLYLSTSPVLLRRVLETRPAPRARVLAGYAGWGPGQLDGELAQSAWLMADVEVDLVFDIDAAVMWETAIRRLGADPSALHTSRGVH